MPGHAHAGTCTEPRRSTARPLPSSPRDGGPWRRPMASRDTAEEHRASTPLELLFDLCFVVAVAQAGDAAPPRRRPTAHAGQRGRQLRARVLRHLVGVDELHVVRVGLRQRRRRLPAAHVRADRRRADPRRRRAARVRRTATSTSCSSATWSCGSALVSLWLRAARHDPRAPDAPTHRFAAGESLCMVGWVRRALIGWPVWAFVVMGVAELLVPVVGRARRRRTPWHPEHIAERYGLFTHHRAGRDDPRRRRSRSRPWSTTRTGDATAVLTAVGGAAHRVLACGGSTSPSRPRDVARRRTGSRSSGATATTSCSRGAPRSAPASR